MDSTDLYNDILYRESRGRRYDNQGNLLRSRAGALGEMQVMPATSRDPGFGVTPARDESPDELARVGRDYADALMNRYGDKKLAMMAYNWGPGNVDRWIAGGADPSRVPAETRKYVQGIESGVLPASYGGKQQQERAPQEDRKWEVELPSGKKYQVQAPTPEIAWSYAMRYEEETAVPPAQEPQKPKGSFMGDVGKSLQSGLYGLAQLPSNLYGIATGDYDALGGDTLRKKQEAIRAGMSDEYLAQQEAAQKAIAEAEKSGELSGAWEAIKQYTTSPRLLSGMIAENVPQMIGGMGAGKLASMGVTAAAKKGLQGAAAKAAAKAAAEKAAAVGSRTAIGTMASMQGGDVAQQSYEDIYKEATKRGLAGPEARRLATEGARQAGLTGGVVSLATMAALPGAEKFMFKGTGAKTALGGAAKGFAGEATQEALEEGGGKMAQNYAMQSVNPDQPLMKGVGATAAQAAILGGIMGGPMGAVRTKATLNYEAQQEQIRQLREQAQAAYEQGQAEEAQALAAEAARQEQELRQSILAEEEQQISPEELRQQQLDEAQRQRQEQTTRDNKAAQWQQEPTPTEDEQDELNAIATTRQGTPTVITEDQLRLWGFNKGTRVYKNLLGKDMSNPDDVEFINAAINPLLEDPKASERHRNNLTKLLEQVQSTYARYAPQPTQQDDTQAASEEMMQRELEQEQAQGGEQDQSLMDLWDSVFNQSDQADQTEVINAEQLAAQEEKVRKDAEWAKRMAEQNAIAQAQKEFEAKRNAEAKAKLEGAYAAAQEASRKRAEQRAAEKAAANGWAEAEHQKALDEEFIVEDTRNREAFAQAAAGTQGELTGIGAQPAEATPAGQPTLNDLVSQYLDARERVNSDPTAEYQMQDIAELGRELYGKSWTQAKYNATSRTQGKLDFDGKQSAKAEKAAAEKAAAEEAQRKAEEEAKAKKAEEEKQRKAEERRAKAEAKKKADAEAKAEADRVAALDPMQIIRDLNAISADEGNSETGKRARALVNEAKKGTGDIAVADAFIQDHKAAKAKKKAAVQKEVKTAAAEATNEDIDAKIAQLQNKLAEEDAKDEPNQNRIAALENQISKLRRQRVKTTKADMDEAVSADRNVPNVSNGDLQWKDAHEILSGETTLVDALNIIRMIPNLADTQKTLIDALLRSKSVISATFSVKPENKTTDKGEHQTGGYAPETNHVNLYNGGGIKTLLHEAVHSAVFGALETDTAFKTKMEALLAKAKEHLDAEKYGLTDIQEFAAEAMANPEFQHALATIPASGPVVSKLNNLWRKFVDATRTLLGIPQNAATLLDEVMSAVIPHVGGKFIATKRGEAANVARDAALSTLEQMRRTVATPDNRTFMQRAEQVLDSVSEITPASAQQAFVSSMDKFRTKFLSSNTAFYNAVRREMQRQGKSAQEVIGALISMSDSQALHSESLAHEFLLRGGLEFEVSTSRWKAKDANHNFVVLHNSVADLMNAHGLTQEQADSIVQAAMEARRIDSIRKAGNKNDVTLHMTPEQTAMGMSLFKTMPELNQIANQWDGIRKNTIKLLESTGIYSKAQAEAYMDSIGYVPFYRDQADMDNAGDALRVSQNLRVKKEKALKGDKDLAVHNVIHNMERWVMFGVDRAIRNAQAARMVDFSQANMPEGFIKKLHADAPGAVRLLRNGKFEYYQMQDPLFAEAFHSLESFGVKWPKVMIGASNLLRQSVVLNPVFGISQVAQDSFAAIMSSGLSPKYAFKIPYVAVKEYLKTLFDSSSAHKALREYGAVGSPDVTATMARLDAEVEAGFRSLSPSGKLLRGLRKMSMASDNSVRQAIWLLAKEQGMSDAEALEKSFEVINFRRHGSSGAIRSFAQLIPFFNAYLQAMNTAYKVVTGEGISPSERKAALLNLAHTTAMVMTMSVLYAMANGDDEDYLEKDAVVRDRLLMIPGTGLSIPLRPDVFLLPKVVAEHSYLLMSDNGTEDGAKARKSLANALGNSVLGPTPVPQAIKPFIEVGLNHNFFTGRAIVGSHMKGLETNRQFSASTSELAKALGQTRLVSPLIADHLIRGVFGSVGGATMWASNLMLTPEGVSRPDTSARDLIASLPGMGQFVTKEHGSGLKTDFYDLRSEVETVVNTFNDLVKRNPAQAADYIKDEDRQRLYSMKGAVASIGQSLTQIRDAINYINEAPDTEFTAEQKREEIDKLREVEAQLLKGVDLKQLRAIAGM